MGYVTRSLNGFGYVILIPCSIFGILRSSNPGSMGLRRVPMLMIVWELLLLALLLPTLRL